MVRITETLTETLKEQAHRVIHRYKFENNSDSHLNIRIENENGELAGFLIPVQSKEILDSESLIELMAKWREENSFAFPTQFKVTITGTSSWYDNQLINNKERMLFIISTPDKKHIGHIGISTFNFDKNSCEIDNVVRGVKEGYPGIMTFALKALIEWTKKELPLVEHTLLRVFSDNEKAIKYYEGCGFSKVREIPLVKKVSEGMVKWEPLAEGSNEKIDKYFTEMILDNYEKEA